MEKEIVVTKRLRAKPVADLEQSPAHQAKLVELAKVWGRFDFSKDFLHFQNMF